MSEYEIAKDLLALQTKVDQQDALLEQLYNIIDHNMKAKVLRELPKKETK